MTWKRLLIFFSAFFVSGLFLILSPSQTQAVELTTTVEPTGRTYQIRNNWRCYGSVDGAYSVKNATNYGECFYWRQQTVQNSYISRIYTSYPIDVAKGNYYTTTFIYGSNDSGTPSVQWTLNTHDSDWALVEFKELSQGSQYNKMTFGYSSNNQMVDGAFTSVQNYKIFQITLQAKNTGNYTWFVGWDTNTALLWGNNYQIQMSDIVEYKAQNIGSVNQEQQQAGQQAQTDGQQGSSTSQNDAQSASTTLLGAFNGFVGAITAISPSNCNISGNFGHLDVGTLNLCQDSPPAFVSTILSLVSVALLVPLSIHLAKRMIGLFRSFTNG